MFSSAPFWLLFTCPQDLLFPFPFDSSDAQNLSIISSPLGAVSLHASPQQRLHVCLCFVTINIYPFETFFSVLVFTLRC